jgi:hypothetical protein
MRLTANRAVRRAVRLERSFTGRLGPAVLPMHRQNRVRTLRSELRQPGQDEPPVGLRPHGHELPDQFQCELMQVYQGGGK